MSIDGGLRKMFHNRLKVGIHWQALETGVVGQGVPDSNYCVDPGVEGWIEFKQTDGWTCPLRTEQVGWILTRINRGGRVFVITRRVNAGGPRIGAAVDELWIHRGADTPQLMNYGLRGASPVIVFHEGPERWDWTKIRKILLL